MDSQAGQSAERVEGIWVDERQLISAQVSKGS